MREDFPQLQVGSFGVELSVVLNDERVCVVFGV